MRTSCRSALLVSLLVGSAQAGNDDEIPVGAQAAMSAAAITATVSDGAAGFYNPAGLAHNARPTFDVTASIYGMRLVSTDGLLQTPGGERSSASTIDWVLAPSAVAYTRALGPKVNASFGIFIPKSTDIILRATLETEDGQSWLGATNRVANDYYYVLSAGFRVTERLRLGASLQVTYSSVIETNQLAGGTPGIGGSFLEYSSIANQGDYGVAALGGLQLDLGSSLVLGVSLRSPTLDVFRFGESSDALTLRVDPEGEDLSGLDLAVEDLTGFIAEMGLPARLRVGLAYELGGGWIAADFDVAAPVDGEDSSGRDWNVNGRLGFMLPLRPGWQLGAGLFTDQSPELEYQVDFYGGTVGVSFSNHHLADEKRRLTFSSVLAGRYAYGTGTGEGLLVPPLEENVGFEVAPSSVGVHELGATIGGGVHF